MRIVSFLLQSCGFSTALAASGWILLISLTLSTMAISDDDYGQIPPVPHHHQPLISDLLEEALNYAASSQHDSRPPPVIGNSDVDPLMDRFRKASSGAQPKYDPGYKFMGLGKRPATTQPLGPKIFPDLRHFFEAARDQLLEQYRSGGNAEEAPPVPAKVPLSPSAYRNDNEALKFVQRSKESGENAPRKTHYNPSLYWTGLGR